MKTDAEILQEGIGVLARTMGLVEAERFVVLVQRERFDYTRWRKTLFADLSLAELSRRADAFAARRGRRRSTARSGR